MSYHWLEHRVLQTIRQHRLFGENDHVLIALSGGLDSISLLHLLHRLHFNVAAAHVNFRLRESSSEKDASFCEEICRQLQIPFHLKAFDTAALAEQENSSIQTVARQLRYRWFHELTQTHGYTVIATAHHLNDQAETVLLHLSDGKSAEALRGIPIRNGKIVRPFLEITRAEIEAYATEKKLSWREDESNLTNDYKRNYFRHEVLPAIEKVQPAAVSNISRTAARLNEWNQLAGEMAEKILHPCFEEKNETTILHLQTILQHPAAGVLLWKALAPFGFDGDIIDQLRLHIDQSGKTYFSAGYCITTDRNKLLIEPREKEIAAPVTFDDHVEFIHFTGYKFTQRKIARNSPLPTTGKNIALLDEARLRYPLTIRTWRNGDTFVPLGMQSSKKLSDFFIDLKIPVPEKKRIPIICSGEKIIWVAGYRMNDHFKVTDETQTIVILEMNEDVAGNTV